MIDHNDTGATGRPWSYDIQHGPNGEEIYAWVYYHNLMVCTVKVHHARLIVEAVNAYEPLKARLAEVEGQRAELASKLSHLVDSLKHAEARTLDAEARIAVLEEVLERADYYIERLERVQQRKRVRDMCEAMEGYRIARTALATSRPAPVEAKQRDTWNASKHDEIIKRLMEQVGMPNSRSLYQAFKQFANELHHIDLGASATAPSNLPSPTQANY